MNIDEISYAKTVLSNKFLSLENDFKRAYIVLNQYELQSSPFPILMYSLSVLDFLSALLAGWSDTNKQLKRYQTDRMVTFCIQQLAYGLNESLVLINVHRHSLMHTSDPRVMPNQTKTIYYGWQIMNENPNHMSFVTQSSPKLSSNTILLNIGVGSLIKDMKNYLIKPDGYFSLLDKDTVVQGNYTSCIQELDNKLLKI